MRVPTITREAISRATATDTSQADVDRFKRQQSDFVKFVEGLPMFSLREKAAYLSALHLFQRCLEVMDDVT